MDKYYHFTSYNCLDNICYYGLVPQIGFRSKSINDDRCGVFLSKGMDKAINMYSLLLMLYLEHSGENGLRLIKSYDEAIKTFTKIINHGSASEHINQALNDTIERKKVAEQIYNCNSFSEYLGGEGCFLSVSGIDNIVLDNSQECFCDKTIPPSNISILVLQNKITNELIDSREAVLAYFMNIYSANDVIRNSVNDDSIQSIRYLYEFMSKLGYECFNKENFNLFEVPIKSYNYTNHKIKAITFS